MKPKLVLVEWEDSRQPSSGWVWLDDVDLGEAVPCKTAGWIIAESKSVMAVAQNIGDNGDQACGIIRIPKRCVVKVTKLKEPRDGE